MLYSHIFLIFPHVNLTKSPFFFVIQLFYIDSIATEMASVHLRQPTNQTNTSGWHVCACSVPHLHPAWGLVSTDKSPLGTSLSFHYLFLGSLA